MTTGEHITQVTSTLLYNRLIKQAYKTFKNIGKLLQINKKRFDKALGKGKKDLKWYRGLYSRRPGSYTPHVTDTLNTVDLEVCIYWWLEKKPKIQKDKLKFVKNLHKSMEICRLHVRMWICFFQKLNGSIFSTWTLKRGYLEHILSSGHHHSSRQQQISNSIRLEKISKVTKPNLWPNTTISTKP